MGSANRAGACTSAAINASVSVDNILAVALRDSAYRTSISASAASDALVRNYICHSCFPPVLKSWYKIPITKAVCLI